VPTARVWRRYCHLRIYVPGDIELGSCDLWPGHFQLDRPAMTEDSGQPFMLNASAFYRTST
jgi:hypothetical protein